MEQKRPGRKGSAMISLTEACRRLRCRYGVGYDYYLRNRLKGRMVKGRIKVTAASVEAMRSELGLVD